MAKKQNKSAADSCGVTQKEGKYFCIDCGAEVTVNHHCPSCSREINWVAALADTRKVGQNFF